MAIAGRFIRNFIAFPIRPRLSARIITADTTVTAVMVTHTRSRLAYPPSAQPESVILRAVAFTAETKRLFSMRLVFILFFSIFTWWIPEGIYFGAAPSNLLLVINKKILTLKLIILFLFGALA